MSVVRWQFTDPVTSEVYTFAMNPNDGGTPSFTKTVSSTPTSAPDGRVILFEGRDAVQTVSFSGTLLYQAQYDAFKRWYDKRHQVSVTDDLGRSFSIYITGFDAKRKRAASHPWKHEYTLTYIIVDWQ